MDRMVSVKCMTSKIIFKFLELNVLLNTLVTILSVIDQRFQDMETFKWINQQCHTCLGIQADTTLNQLDFLILGHDITLNRLPAMFQLWPLRFFSQRKFQVCFSLLVICTTFPVSRFQAILIWRKMSHFVRKRAYEYACIILHRMSEVRHCMKDLHRYIELNFGHEIYS